MEKGVQSPFHDEVPGLVINRLPLFPVKGNSRCFGQPNRWSTAPRPRGLVQLHWGLCCPCDFGAVLTQLRWVRVGCLPAAKSCSREVFALGGNPGGEGGSRGTFPASSLEQVLNARALARLGSRAASPHLSGACPGAESCRLWPRGLCSSRCRAVAGPGRLTGLGL